MPGTPETVIAFDFGLRRIGVAVGQQVTNSANPLDVVANGADGPDWTHMEKILQAWRPARLLVGLPTSADGSPTEITQLVHRFIEQLARFELPVVAVDEQFTSLEANTLLKEERRLGLRGRISKNMVDSAAATLIAERWLKNPVQQE